MSMTKAEREAEAEVLVLFRATGESSDRVTIEVYLDPWKGVLEVKLGVGCTDGMMLKAI